MTATHSGDGKLKAGEVGYFLHKETRTDGTDLFWLAKLVGDLPDGAEAFGQPLNWEGSQRSLLVPLPGGELMPVRAALDYCRDCGREPLPFEFAEELSERL
jgi:hypothetical protein